MKVLLDENLHENVALALHAVNPSDTVLHIVTEGHAGMQDPQIPPYCESQGVEVLVTANVKDFGAKKVYFEALLRAGVSVIVARPGHYVFTPHGQLGILAPRFPQMLKSIAESESPLLFTVSPSGYRERSLDELAAEIAT